MKFGKKILSAVCVAGMVASMGITAFADGPTAGSKEIKSISGNNTAEIDVQLESETIPAKTETYFVNVKWESMAFKYETDTKIEAGTWDHDTHKWSNTSGGKWTGGGAEGESSMSTITVVNHSSAGVTVNGTYAAKNESGYRNETTKDGVTVTFNTFSDTDLVAGNENNTGDGKDDNSGDDNVATATVSVTGDPETTISNAVVGAVTVTISPAL